MMREVVSHKFFFSCRFVTGKYGTFLTVAVAGVQPAVAVALEASSVRRCPAMAAPPNYLYTSYASNAVQQAAGSTAMLQGVVPV